MTTVFNPTYAYLVYGLLFLLALSFKHFDKINKYLFRKAEYCDSGRKIKLLYRCVYETTSFTTTLFTGILVTIPLVLPVFLTVCLFFTDHYLIHFFFLNAIFLLPFISLPKSEGLMVFIPALLSYFACLAVGFVIVVARLAMAFF